MWTKEIVGLVKVSYQSFSGCASDQILDTPRLFKYGFSHKWHTIFIFTWTLIVYVNVYFADILRSLLDIVLRIRISHLFEKIQLPLFVLVIELLHLLDHTQYFCILNFMGSFVELDGLPLILNFLNIKQLVLSYALVNFFALS